MKQIGLASYEKRISRAARTLLEHQGFDGGWGLTLTSVSSIVNTSEVLPILHAAGIGGKPVRDALSYLSGAIGVIAAALHVAPSSVAKYVQRLNRVVADAFGGVAVKLVVTCSTVQGSGYVLAARSASIG